jgi:hypothetical protein
MSDSSNKFYLGLIAIFFIVVIAIAVLFLVTDDTGELIEEQPIMATSTEVQSIPVDEFAPVEGEGSIVLLTKGQQGTVRVKDFLQTDQVELLSETATTKYYRIASEQGDETPIYEIFYSVVPSGVGGITVSLQDTNLFFARDRAEAALQELLGLPQEAMCELQITVNTPRTTSEEFSGRDLGLSFCPGATAL